MKNRRALIFAVALGLSAAVLTHLYWTRKEQHFQTSFKNLPVLIAKTDIPRYTVIDETLLELRNIPQPYVQPAAVLETDIARVVGNVADATIRKGEQITMTKIARTFESRISISIPTEQRACTVAVSDITGVAGLIRPGDHVDVIGLFRTLDDKGRSASDAEAMAVLQNVQVLAVGRNYMQDSSPASGRRTGILGESSGGFSNVTLALSPRHCMDLTVAQNVGTLSLALRSYMNRFGGDVHPELKDKHSTVATVTGIQKPLEIGPAPKWMEMRGDTATFVP